MIKTTLHFYLIVRHCAFQHSTCILACLCTHSENHWLTTVAEFGTNGRRSAGQPRLWHLFSHHHLPAAARAPVFSIITSTLTIKSIMLHLRLVHLLKMWASCFILTHSTSFTAALCQYILPPFKCFPSPNHNSPRFHLWGAILSQPSGGANKAL